MNRQAWIVAYDITDNRCRYRLRRLLLGFGVPVQKSVFLCHLDGRRKARLENLISRIELESGDRLELFRAEAALSLSPGGQPAALQSPGPLVIIE